MASNPGTSSYPATLDDFADPGTASFEDDLGMGHHSLHAQVHDAVEKIEATLGTTAGTSVIKDFTAGKFAVYTTGGTLNNGVLGTPAITGGTLNTVAFTNFKAPTIYFDGTTATNNIKMAVFSIVKSAAGTATLEKFTQDIAGIGFGTTPNGIAQLIDVNEATHYAMYDYGDSSATVASVSCIRFDGGTITAGAFRYGLFLFGT